MLYLVTAFMFEGEAVLNPNILSQRYATSKMNLIFSEEGKTRLEREFWLSVLKIQRDLGLNIPPEAIQAYEESVDKIDLGLIREIGTAHV